MEELKELVVKLEALVGVIKSDIGRFENENVKAGISIRKNLQEVRMAAGEARQIATDKIKELRSSIE